MEFEHGTVDLDNVEIPVMTTPLLKPLKFPYGVYVRRNGTLLLVNESSQAAFDYEVDRGKTRKNAEGKYKSCVTVFSEKHASRYLGSCEYLGEL